MTLTTEQLTTLGNDIQANAEVAAALTAGRIGDIADWYNGPSDFWLWKQSVSAGEIGIVIDLQNLGNIIAANSERLQTAFVLLDAFYPNRTDHRAFFADMFSGAVGDETRAALIVLWQTLGSEAEKLFATGTGTQATGEIDDSTGLPDAGDPGAFVFSGSVSVKDIDLALEATQ